MVWQESTLPMGALVVVNCFVFCFPVNSNSIAPDTPEKDINLTETESGMKDFVSHSERESLSHGEQTNLKQMATF